jgi:AraC-like DNA-binding protein
MSLDLTSLSPFLRLAHDFRTPVDFQLPWRRINDHALLFFRAGAGRLAVNETAYSIQPGALFFIRPNDDRHCFAPRAGTAFHMYNLHFDLVERADSRSVSYGQPAAGPRRRLPASEVLSHDPTSPCHLPVFAMPSAPAYERLFLRALHAFPLPGTASVLRRKAAVLDILAFLMGGVSAPAREERDDGLDRAIARIHAGLSGPLALADLAQAADMGRSAFAAAFHLRFEMAPMEYVRHVRIETARHELLQLGLPVKVVAQRNGFANVHHFTRVFTRLTGFTPARLRSTGVSERPRADSLDERIKGKRRIGKA